MLKAVHNLVNLVRCIIVGHPRPGTARKSPTGVLGPDFRPHPTPEGGIAIEVVPGRGSGNRLEIDTSLAIASSGSRTNLTPESGKSRENIAWDSSWTLFGPQGTLFWTLGASGAGHPFGLFRGSWPEGPERPLCQAGAFPSTMLWWLCQRDAAGASSLLKTSNTPSQARKIQSYAQDAAVTRLGIPIACYKARIPRFPPTSIRGGASRLFG